MSLPLGFVPPCLPTKAPHPPTGELWLHEIKHDGFRVIARKDGGHIRLYSRAGNDLTDRFPLIVEALGRLRSRQSKRRSRRSRPDTPVDGTASP
jgi:ATP-dependent DNA ligase